jgi:hypothetical protein
MRALIATCVAGALVASGTFATAKPAPPKPDLVTSDVVPALTGSTLAVYATVKNKGKKKAKANTAAFHLSTDPVLDPGDVLLGTAAVPKLKPKKQVTIYPFLTVPGSVPAGSYYVVVCADSEGKVKEKKETNNCAVSPGSVTIAPPVGDGNPPVPPGSYSVEVTPYFDSISVNGDTPSPQHRTLFFAAGTQVVLTVSGPAPNYTWAGDWRSGAGHVCDGTLGDAAVNYSMTFTSLSHNVDCEAHAPLEP